MCMVEKELGEKETGNTLGGLPDQAGMLTQK
jgi:hypothetical protein